MDSFMTEFGGNDPGMGIDDVKPLLIGAADEKLLLIGGDAKPLLIGADE